MSKIMKYKLYFSDDMLEESLIHSNFGSGISCVPSIFDTIEDAIKMVGRDYQIIVSDMIPLEAHYAIIECGEIVEDFGYMGFWDVWVCKLQPDYLELRTIEDCVRRLEAYFEWDLRQEISEDMSDE